VELNKFWNGHGSTHSPAVTEPLFMTDKASFSNLAVTHEHEEKLRAESMMHIHADAELSRRLLVIQTAMTVIFGYTVDHISRSVNETTVQLLGIRLFNPAFTG
jgi:hypothetical protein